MARADGKTKLTVVSELGTFTRTTARKYTHLVVSCGNDPHLIRTRAAAQLKSDKSYHRKYSEAMELAAKTGRLVCSIDGNSIHQSDMLRATGMKPGTLVTDDDATLALLGLKRDGHYDMIGFWDVDQWREFVTSSASNIATHDAELAARLAANDYEIESRKYGVHGWASRLDLAERVYVQRIEHGHLNVHIIEVATGKVVR